MTGLRLVQTVAPQAEPIETADVYVDHLRGADLEAERSYVERLVVAARRQGERFTRRSWMPQTWQLSRDRFPSACEDGGCLLLPRGPLIAVLSVEYIDSDGEPQTLDPDAYKVSDAGRENVHSRITPAYGTVWPTTRCEVDAVTVTYRAGYIDGGSPETADVPQDLVHGMLLVIGELYKQRSESVLLAANPAMIRAKDLWLPYRIY